MRRAQGEHGERAGGKRTPASSRSAHDHCSSVKVARTIPASDVRRARYDRRPIDRIPRHPPVPFLYRRAANLPLPVAHALGAAIGARLDRAEQVHCRTAFIRALPPTSARAARAASPRALVEVGQGPRRLPVLWSGPAAGRAAGAEVRGSDEWDRARSPREGRDRLAASRRVGIAGLEYSRRHSIVTMYRLQGNVWDDVMKRGRERFGAKLVPSDRGGVRELLEAPRRGDSIGVLPDQDPPEGSGAFAPFFGITAHTPVLAPRLARRTGAPGCLAGGSGGRIVSVRRPAPPEVADARTRGRAR
jgi:KDO2-lipid IV(A) lauroyltransferase